MSSFKLQTSFKVDYAPATVKKWRSERTGLQATLIDQKSPVVKGYFAVATEIEDDSGCPHTLEHLIFMGSKRYPYKGLLDTLGNLAFSSTNAWTGTDQTVYTLSTAGWEGFKMLLPVYLDHLMNPTLTDEACYTEVYHIDSDAKEKGVVFSEMIANVTNGWYLTTLEAQRSLYAPTSGYSSETGGLIESLRVLTNDRIRKYHADNYRPDNLNVIITGTVDETEFLKIMEEFDSELPTLPSTPQKRPFVDSPRDLPLRKEILREVEFPDKDESTGQLLMSWIGPAATNYLDNVAIDILGTYLTDSAISLLQKNLVEIEDPLAVEVYYYTEDFIDTSVNLMAIGVPTERLQECREKMQSLLSSAMNSFDLERMRQVLETSKLQYVFQTEKTPDNLATIAIEHFLYGKVDGSDLPEWIKDLKEYEILANWSQDQWADLLNKYFVENKSCTVLGKPSASMYSAKKKENKDLLEKRKKDYDLDELKNKLQKAMEFNDRPIPDELLTEFGQPDPSKVEFIKSTTITAGLDSNDADKDATSVGKLVSADTPVDFPLSMNFESFDSQFVSVTILASSFQVDEDLLPYLRIFEDIFSLPIKLADGTEIPYETVISEIKKETVSYRCSMGFNNSFEELISLNIKAPRTNYAKLVEWLERVMYFTKFDKARVRVSVEKEINSLPDYKRSGSSILRSVTNEAFVTERSLKKSTDPLHNEEFYKSLLEKIDSEEYSEVEAKLEKLRWQVLKSNNLRVLVCGDVESIAQPVSTWANFAKTASSSGDNEKTLNAISRTFSALTEIGQNCSGQAFLMTTPASEATYLHAVTKLPTDYLHSDIPKIALASSYLQSIEGPFWRGIRGTGLAYGANVSRDLECGQLSFEIYRGADGEKCFDVGKQIVQEYADGTKKFEKTLIEGAISSLVNHIAELQYNNFSAAVDKFTDNVLMQRGPDYNTKSLRKLRDVTAEDLIYAIRKYFVPMFESSKSCVFASVHPSKAEGLTKHLQALGYQVSVKELTIDEDEDDDEEDGSEEEEESEDDYSDEESD